MNPDRLTPKIGNTPLIEAKKLGKLIGLPHLYLKVESKNPTGTHKDRAALAIVDDVVANGYLSLTIGTCGNFGASLAALCNENKINCSVFIPKRYKSERRIEIEKSGAKIFYSKRGYEEAVEESSMYAKTNGCYDANPSSSQSSIASINGYAAIASEICNSIHMEELESVWVVVGNGTTLSGLHNGFSNRGYSPRYGAVSSKNNNAILESFNRNSLCELDSKSLVETIINEPLLNWRSYQVKEAMIALKKNGLAYGATDQEMVDASIMIYREEKIRSNPASAAVLTGIVRNKMELDPHKSHVLILTS